MSSPFFIKHASGWVGRMPDAAHVASNSSDHAKSGRIKVGLHSTLRVSVPALARNPINRPFYRLDSLQHVRQKLAEWREASICFVYNLCRSMPYDLGGAMRP